MTSRWARGYLGHNAGALRSWDWGAYIELGDLMSPYWS
jgi:hypothetical protein